MSHSPYLHDIPLPEAQARLQNALQAAGRYDVLGIETIPCDEKALGRVLAAPVWAKISSPHYHAAAMDGFALCARDTIGAQLARPLTLSLSAEAAGRAAYVDTGDALPAWADAVIPIENVEALTGDGALAEDPRRPAAIRIRAAVTPWSHVRLLGEDMVATQLVLPAGQRLRAVDLGAAAACGNSELQAARRPRVAVMPTGSELTPVGQNVQAGQIIETNSITLAAQVNAWGGAAQRFPIIPDHFETICQQVQRAAEDFDLILLNAGSSAGSEDFSARVVETLGELLVHGVAVRPGHPVILGMIHASAGRRTPIIGVPGYPVSAALTAEIFVQPLLGRWLGETPPEAPTVNAILTRKITSPAGDDDYQRMAVARVGERLLAAPLNRGAGVITSLLRADGIAVLPRGVQGLAAGAEIKVRLYRSAAELERTILAIGSHDIALDVMAQFLARRGRRLASANVGSQGGLVALRRGEAHLAGCHLLDAASGEYNLAAVREYLGGMAVRVVALVGRTQGLLTQPGNLKQIHSLADLQRAGVSFVNRQRGAGTRVLLDYQLNQQGIAAEAVRGYEQEEYTHLAVAAAVASGRADCGLGIAAAAQALGLDFVPLFQERYDLIIPSQHAGDPLLGPLFEVLAEPAYQQAVGALPGYEVSWMGKLIAEIE